MTGLDSSKDFRSVNNKNVPLAQEEKSHKGFDDVIHSLNRLCAT